MIVTGQCWRPYDREMEEIIEKASRTGGADLGLGKPK